MVSEAEHKLEAALICLQEHQRNLFHGHSKTGIDSTIADVLSGVQMLQSSSMSIPSKTR
jgi:hypothetical protein